MVSPSINAMTVAINSSNQSHIAGASTLAIVCSAIVIIGNLCAAVYCIWVLYDMRTWGK